MTSAEHSTLVFLCLAIEAAPEKADYLLVLAHEGDHSEEYHEVVSDLVFAPYRVMAATEIRKKLRMS